jgi:hypothetical protein
MASQALRKRPSQTFHEPRFQLRGRPECEAIVTVSDLGESVREDAVNQIRDAFAGQRAPPWSFPATNMRYVLDDAISRMNDSWSKSRPCPPDALGVASMRGHSRKKEGSFLLKTQVAELSLE